MTIVKFPKRFKTKTDPLQNFYIKVLTKAKLDVPSLIDVSSFRINPKDSKFLKNILKKQFGAEAVPYIWLMYGPAEDKNVKAGYVYVVSNIEA